jgi:hypothetical protein
MPQCVKDQRTHAATDLHGFRARVLEVDALPPERNDSGRAIGKVKSSSRNLLREAEQIRRDSSRRLDVPSVFACDGLSDLIDIRAQDASQRGISAGVVVQPTSDTPNEAGLDQF